MITFVGSQDAESNGLITTGFLDRTRQWQLWLRFALTEHCVLMMRVIILSLSPSFPRWINDAAEILEYRVDTRYLTQEHLVSPLPFLPHDSSVLSAVVPSAICVVSYYVVSYYVVSYYVVSYYVVS
eukprot:COSAG05_NODE_4778_length_1376_cov_2240.562255_2_plen_126_part_00